MPGDDVAGGEPEAVEHVLILRVHVGSWSGPPSVQPPRLQVRARGAESVGRCEHAHGRVGVRGERGVDRAHLGDEAFRVAPSPEPLETQERVRADRDGFVVGSASVASCRAILVAGGLAGEPLGRVPGRCLGCPRQGARQQAHSRTTRAHKRRGGNGLRAFRAARGSGTRLDMQACWPETGKELP